MTIGFCGHYVFTVSCTGVTLEMLKKIVVTDKQIIPSSETIRVRTHLLLLTIDPPSPTSSFTSGCLIFNCPLEYSICLEMKRMLRIMNFVMISV